MPFAQPSFLASTNASLGQEGLGVGGGACSLPANRMMEPGMDDMNDVEGWLLRFRAALSHLAVSQGHGK